VTCLTGGPDFANSSPAKPRINKSSAKRMFTGGDASCRKRCRVRTNATSEYYIDVCASLQELTAASLSANPAQTTR
jgi:hypothetical protein